VTFSLYNRFRQLEKVRVDKDALEAYLGASSSDGVLRTSSPLSYIDGGDYITLGLDTTANIVTSGTLGCGKLTVDAGVGQSIILKGTSTGNSNLCYIGFYDSNGTTRRGYVGDGSSSDDDIYLAADTGYLRLLAAGYINLGTHTYFPDDVVMSFGASLDYSIGFAVATDTLQIVNGSTLGSNIRLKLDSSGHFDFGAGNLITTGTLGSGAFTLTQNSDTITLSHDGSNAYFKWSDGDLALMTDEGTNTDTHVSILGKGTGVGLLEVYDTDEDSYIILGWKGDDQPTITTDATPSEFNLLHDRAIDIKCWSSISSGNPYFYSYGYHTGVGVKYLRQRVEADGDALIESEGNLNIIAGGGDINLGDGGTTNYASLSAVGQLTLVGTARVWKEIIIGAGSFHKGSSAPIDGYINGVVHTLDFNSNDTAQHGHYNMLVSSDFAVGTEISVEVDWYFDDIEADHYTTWEIQYLSLTDGEDPATATTTIYQKSVISTGNNDKQIHTIFGTGITGAVADDTLSIRLSRDTDATNDTDDLAQDARLLAVHLHYMADKLGTAST